MSNVGQDDNRIQDSLRFLSDASEVLASSLAYETTLESVARLAVPTFADWCAVDIIEDTGQVRRLAVAHIDPAKVQWALEFQRRAPYDPDAPAGVPKVLRTGEPEFYPNVTDEMLVASIPDPERLAIAREIGFTSAMIVPLIARGRTLGAITLVSAESGHHYTDEDLQVARHLARRSALAVDNARLYQDAQRALEIRSRFLSIASHELQTPITLISGYMQVLTGGLSADSLANPRAVRALEVVNRNIIRMRRLIHELLDASRIEAGSLEFRYTECDLAEVVREAVIDMRVMEPKIEFVLKAPEGPVPGRMDRQRIETVINNLLTNAVRYGNRAGRVEVTLDTDGESCRLSVRDYGIGVPPEQRERIFEQHFRAANAEQFQGGLGLGLFISKTIIDRHGGTIGVEDAPGGGSIFYFTLPILPASHQATT